MMAIRILILCFAFGVVPFGLGSLLLGKGHDQESSLSLRVLLGTLAIGIFVAALSMIGLPVHVSVVILSMLGIIGALRWGLSSSLTPSNLIEGSLLGIGIVAAAVIAAANVTLEWDGFALWLLKAKQIYFNIPHVHSDYFYYPGLGPGIWAYGFVWLNDSSAPEARAWLGATFLEVVLLIGYNFSRRLAWRIVLALTSCMVLLSIVNISEVFSGYQDLFLLLIGLATLKTIFPYFLGQESTPPLHAWMFLGSMGWIKNEGLIWILCFFISMVVLQLGRTWSLRKLPFRGIALALGIAGAFRILLFANGLDPTEVQKGAFQIQDSYNWQELLARYSVIMPYFWTSFENRLVHFILIGVVTVGLVVARQWKTLLPLVSLGLAWALSQLAILLMFIVTQAPLDWHLSTAFTRLQQSADMFLVGQLLFILIMIGYEPLQVKSKEDINFLDLACPSHLPSLGYSRTRYTATTSPVPEIGSSSNPISLKDDTISSSDELPP